MKNDEMLDDADLFCEQLFELMKAVNPAIERMALYEFRYSLNNISPISNNWRAIKLESTSAIECMIKSQEFFDSIQIKPKVDGKIVLDEKITHLTRMLFVGLVTEDYAIEWVNQHFFFDPRSFNFYVRSIYLTEDVISYLGNQPYKQFEKRQLALESLHEVGYLEFMAANQQVDECFIELVLNLVSKKKMPIVLAIAGPTAAGKTEIVERLNQKFEQANRKVAAIELDNFLTDRDQREERGIGSFGKAALHFELFQACIKDILLGKKITTPRYDFIDGTSSHDLDGKLKPGRLPVDIEPADIIFIEGNSPFLLPEISPLIDIKIVYLTDDPIRLKRKWRRDIDYRKKYDPCYLRNRYFREQPPMAIKNYQPQLKTCDIFVDTTNAAIWVSQQTRKMIE